MTERVPAGEAGITRVLQYYFPGWEPVPNRKKWNQCLCPSHDEDRPSAGINYEEGGIKCQACGFKGDVLAIIMRKEGISFGQAVQRATEILGGSYDPVPREADRQPGRRVFGQPRADGTVSGKPGRKVSPRIRRRSPPWA